MPFDSGVCDPGPTSIESRFQFSMMQFSSRNPNPPRGSPESAEGAAAYNSFVDMAGFATSGHAASFAASSPSHSTSTYNGSPPNNNDDIGNKLNDNKNRYHFENALNTRTSMRVGMEEEEEEYNGVDWPVDFEDETTLKDRKNMLLEAHPPPPPPPPPIYPPPPTTTIISSRNQQIFRAKGQSSSTTGPTGTPPSHSDQSDKGSSTSPNNNHNHFRDGRNIVVAGGGRGGGGGRSTNSTILFESFTTNATTRTTSNTYTAVTTDDNRPRNDSTRSNISSGNHRTSTAPSATTTIFDNIAEVVAARTFAPATVTTTSLVGSKDRMTNNVPNDRHNIMRVSISNNIHTSQTIPNNLSRNTLLSSSLTPSSPELATSPQSEFRSTGMVNKLVSMFSNKQQLQHQSQNTQPIHTSSSRQPTTTSSGGVHFQLPMSTKRQTQLPASAPQLTTNPITTTSPASLSINENYFAHHHQNRNHPVISPARSNTQSSVTGASGDSSSYNPTGWPGTVDRRGRTYGMEPSYSEEDSSHSWSSPRGVAPIPVATAKAVGRNAMDSITAARKELGNIVNGSIDAVVVASMTAGDAMESWHHDSVVDGNSVHEDDEEEGAVNWRHQRRHQSSEIRTAADMQLKAVLGNNQFLRSRQHTEVDRHNGGMQTYHSPPTNNNKISSLEDDEKLHGIDLSGSEERVRTSGRRLASSHVPRAEFSSVYSFSSHNNNSYSHPCPQHVLLSEEALRMKDSQTSPPIEGGSFLFRGYRGFVDKTKDVPNLMDDAESDGGTSMGTGVHSSAGDARRHQQHPAHHTIGLALPSSSSARGTSINRPLSVAPLSNVDSASDVFEGLLQEEQFGPIEEDILDVNSEEEYRMPLKTGNNVAQLFQGENLPYSTQFNPFATRHHRRDFERDHGSDNRYGGPVLNLSAVTRGSSDSSPHHFDYMEDDNEDEFESLPDLSIYYIQPDMVRKLVRAFRKICTSQMEISSSEDAMLHDFENLVDTKKAFALFEMRSRIMETDIDRGLERKGGTNVEDDIVLTPHFQAAARVRDAVIVSKAWRDGATPKDVVTAHLLTRRSAMAHFVPRPIQRIQRRHGSSFFNDDPDCWFEEVRWLDDTDFMLMRCQSLGAGMMKGFEMFTIGDCQSMLLKMTSDNCTVSTLFSLRLSRF